LKEIFTKPDQMSYINKIKENVLLSPYTSFKIGGLARYFVEVENKEEIIKAVEFASDKNLPFFVLGGGSNLLISDQGFDGLIILIRNQGLIVRDSLITAQAGVRLSDLVSNSLKAELTGLEWAIGIPGTLAGAIRGNAGAFVHSISESVKQVEVLNQEFKVVSFGNKACQFGYRDSIFKKNKDIILSAQLELKKGDKEESQVIIVKYLKQRKQKQPLEYPSAGCIFKNPKPLVTARLIEQVGLKGKKIGGAMISEKHANFIINLDQAKAEDVIKLIKLVKQAVKEKFDIELEEEIQYLGDQ